jgi:hypothetical protein
MVFDKVKHECPRCLQRLLVPFVSYNPPAQEDTGSLRWVKHHTLARCNDKLGEIAGG